MPRLCLRGLETDWIALCEAATMNYGISGGMEPGGEIGKTLEPQGVEFVPHQVLCHGELIELIALSEEETIICGTRGTHNLIRRINIGKVKSSLPGADCFFM
ncbi:hypothetical protein GCM10010954_10480 [Halobacillus andaensis]|uniref:Uncharacterized protein n=1 Tax=Halobacillus andaensis TaxID=1176239 RepID=A0A917B116_HALAA|nr:hypothetical protein GCM10010954_10480 [Halobacillus andaensis]